MHMWSGLWMHSLLTDSSWFHSDAKPINKQPSEAGCTFLSEAMDVWLFLSSTRQILSYAISPPPLS